MRDLLTRVLDYAQPIVYGVASWLDALLGYRPTPTDEPEIVA